MSIQVNPVFSLGEDWTLYGLILNRDGSVVDLTGATVTVRFAHEGVAILDEVAVIDTPPTAGYWHTTVTPVDQADFPESLETLQYEVQVELSNGDIRTVNYGIIGIMPSLFQLDAPI